MRTGAVPVGDGGQTLGKAQSRGRVLRSDTYRGPKRFDSSFECTLQPLHRTQ